MQLVAEAIKGVRHAYTKHARPDDFRIGAAVLTQAGNVYGSGQYDSDTGSLTLHAEQAALAHAAAHGEYDIMAIAVTWNETAATGDGDDSVCPCHMCKQLMWESSLRSGRDMEVLIVQKGKVIERLMLKSIMNHTWPR